MNRLHKNSTLTLVVATGLSFSSGAFAQDSTPPAEEAAEAAADAAEVADEAAEAADEAADAAADAADEAAAAAEAAAAEAASAAEAAAAETADAAETAVEETADAAEEAADDEAENIVIVGSRRIIRSVLDSPTPVDRIKASDFSSQPSTDMDNLLRSLVPSYNVSPQPISDAATLIRPANLRGLPPDSTLVLVNGKRRHRGSVISFLGSGLADGSQGVDLAPIPSLALKQVDVLRDGAAAQYGSDAIAGVLNFVLRDDADGATVMTKLGSTFEGDGFAWSVAGNMGVPLTENGFFNLSIEYGNVDATSRSVQRTDAQALRDSGNLAVRDPAQIWGSPQITDDVKVFANLGFKVDDNTKFYAFGNVARRDVLGGFFFRNPTNRGGVYSSDGGSTLLVFDLTPGDGNACPTVNVNDGIINQGELDTVVADPNCFVFNELFPGGFTPNFGGTITDVSGAAGIKGVTDFGLSWDLSAVVGMSETAFRIVNTINASLGPDTPTEFNPGTYREVDQSYNIDLAQPVDIGLWSPLTVAAGGEYRQEAFTVEAGDPASYAIGPFADQGGSIGSNGFPGFSQDIAGTFTRRNGAGYLDLTADIIEALTMSLAGRYESFDSFGDQATFKAATRIGLDKFIDLPFADALAIRGAVGTGFRAPSAGQANVSNISTVATGATLQNRGTIPPTNPIAASKGGTELEPEKSLNITGGIVMSLFGDFSLTVDYYFIQVRDRISQSATQTLTPEEAQALEASGIRGATDLQEFRFFTNAFDTETQGIDVVATEAFEFGDAGRLGLSLAYAWNETSVTDFTAGIVDAQRIAELTEALPNHRVVLTGNYFLGDLRLMLRGSFYDEFANPTNAAGDLNDIDDFTFGATFLVDAEIGYTFFDHFTAVVGAQNLTNTFPDENPQSLQQALGAVYPENSPIGFNGGFYYVRLQATL